MPAKMSCRFPIAGLGCIALFVLSAASADPLVPDAPPQRPRIGLVLGGGGAKGAAHIGVIKVLEEMRVPVDCIAGTSMGAIVGAAYATGMTADELQTVITAVNWKETLTNAPRDDVPVHRKEMDSAFTLGIELGHKANGDLVTPAGIVPTHQIEALFRRIVSGSRQTANFSALPIPFRAVATDLESGAVKVFDYGDLTIAMRASMAVPGAFAPVEYKGRLYVDGMLVRNLPVDVARDACADVVIAVPVGNPAATRDELKGLLAIASQAMNIAIEANEKAQLATLTDKDVLVPVILPGITSGDFSKVPEAIPIGEAAARAVSTSLARYSLSPAEYAAWRKHVGIAAQVPKVKIDEIRLVGFNVTNPEVMRTYLSVKPGETYDVAKIDRDTTALVARGDYSNVGYQLLTENGRNVLVYTATEKPWGPDYLFLDANLATDFRGDTSWGARAYFDKRWMNSLGGELQTLVQVGEPNLFNVQFYQPVDLSQRFFVAPSVYANQSLQYVYSGDDVAAQLNVRRYGATFDGGITFGPWGELRLGVLRGTQESTIKVGNPALIAPPTSQQLGGIEMRFVYDQIDKRFFATQGSYLVLNGFSSQTELGATQSYRTLELRGGHLFTEGPWVLQLEARGETDFSSDPPYFDQAQGGGLFNFSGYDISELVGRESILGSLNVRRRIADLNETIGTAVYLGGTLEAGNVYERADGSSAHGVILSGSLYLGIASKLGPVYLAYGQSEAGHSTLYLYLGSPIAAWGTQLH